MKSHIFINLKGILFLMLLSAFAVSSFAQAKLTPEQIKEERAYTTGVQALLWGWPLSEYATTIDHGLKSGAVGLGYFHKYDNLKTAADRFIVTPNNVTIDAYGNADLRVEPAVVNVPALKEDRWYIVQISDMYDEIVNNIGGYKGPEPGVYIITGPDFQGTVPLGMTQIKMRSKVAAIGVRIFVKGEADLEFAREAQNGFHLMPLSVFQANGLKYETPKPATDAFPAFTAAAPAEIQGFERMAFAMQQFLSQNTDTDPLLMSFRQIGLSVGKGFEWKTLDEPTKKGLARAVTAAEQIIDDAYATSATIVNGWRYNMGGGRAGYDYALRATFAKNLLGANVAEQLVYPNCRVDADGNAFSGANKYVLHFDKNQIPPVAVFWNMAMYDDKMLFIENDFKRYSIGSTTEGLKTNKDGSIDLYIQKDSPGKDKESNWLPAPAGGFNLTMRMYGAQTEVLDGSYRLPSVKKLK